MLLNQEVVLVRPGQPQAISRWGEKRLCICYAVSMAKKEKKPAVKPKQKSTEWGVGQPLAFPTKKIPTVEVKSR
jgi:hypothetical protein